MSYYIGYSSVEIPVKEDFNLETEINNLVSTLTPFFSDDYEGDIPSDYEMFIDGMDVEDIQPQIDKIVELGRNTLKVSYNTEDHNPDFGEFLQCYFSKFMTSKFVIETNYHIDSREGHLGHSNILTPDGKFLGVSHFVNNHF